MFEKLQKVPVDPILGLSAACRADSNPRKIDLTVGLYRNEAGETPVFQAVQEAQRQLTRAETTKAYIPQAGDAAFLEGIQRLVLGGAEAIIARSAAVQTPGGCGALRIAAEMARAANPAAKVWLSSPTWPNHTPLIGSTGLEFREHRYYSRERHALDFPGMLGDLSRAEPGDLLLLHGCCHNPSGMDLDEGQWREVIALAKARGVTPLIDFAYQGMGDGMEADAFGARCAAEQLPEALIAVSCSKNMGLYRERTGAVVFVGQDADSAAAVASQAMQAARRIYSMPPAHGAILAGKIFADAKLSKSWQNELAAMCERLNQVRAQLAEQLSAATGKDFEFIQRGRGLFSFLGLNEQQVTALRENHSIYMVASSRINVAGVNQTNIDHLVEAVAKVLR